MESRQDFVATCPLCNQPLLLQSDTCADELGRAVHERCYTERLSRENTSANPSAA